MIVLSFIICLLLFNILSAFWAAAFGGTRYEEPGGAPGLLAYGAIMLVSYPRSAEFKRVFEHFGSSSYGHHGIFAHIGSMITAKANSWDWIAAGATGACGLYMLFAWCKAVENDGVSVYDAWLGNYYGLDLQDSLRLFFWAVVAVLVAFGVYKIIH